MQIYDDFDLALSFFPAMSFGPKLMFSKAATLFIGEGLLTHWVRSTLMPHASRKTFRPGGWNNCNFAHPPWRTSPNLQARPSFVA